MKNEHSDSHEWSVLEERVNEIDIEIESAEHAIANAMTQLEEEDLIKYVIKLKQKRKKLFEKSRNY